MSNKASQVTVIPATLTLQGQPTYQPNTKRKVAAYARVSTDSEEQSTSFEAQVDYYTNYINSRPEWEMASIYTDDGITAVNTKKRDGFKKMIADALDGKFSLIVTKSVSRFARNTVDSLDTIRKLKEKGVECYFEKEGIWTFGGKGELLITIMSSLAQEESRSLSENVTWGQRKRFADGKVSMPYKNFLGYEKGEDGKPKIVESEAKIVRDIYHMYLNGYSIRQICKNLTGRGIPTPSGKENWSVSTVKSILQNEKYKGHALLQKTFCEDFLTKKMIKNEGQVPQYYVTDSHPAIINPELYELVQKELAKNAVYGTGRSNASLFSGKIICGECGDVFVQRTWHSKDIYKKKVWQCSGKYKERGTQKCKTPHLTDEQIENAFITTFNTITADKNSYIKEFEKALECIGNTDDIDMKTKVLNEQLADLFERLQALVTQNAQLTDAKQDFDVRYAGLNSKFEDVKEQLAELSVERQSRLARKEGIARFIQTLKSREQILSNFDEQLWRSLVDEVKIYASCEISIIFRNGQKFDTKI